MIIDDVTIHIKAGHGGKGAVAFNKNMMELGPTGGSGGDGGSVFLEGTSDLSALLSYRHKKDWLAQNGGEGHGQFVDGKTSPDLILKVPVGTVAHNLTEGFDIEIVKIGERICMAKGGRGGKGNFQFRSPTNTTPQKFQPGMPGQEAELRLELKLIADVGLIGLPNAGKSSLLNSLTNAKSKVANYQFTTLEPHLGAYYDLLLADIPGLIEGASEGKGLGIKFLRHVERTNILFHLISAESDDVVRDYKIIRAELGAYNKNMLDKDEYVFLSKTDTVTEKEVKEKIAALKKAKIKAIPLSIIEDDKIAELQKLLNKIMEAKHA